MTRSVISLDGPMSTSGWPHTSGPTWSVKSVPWSRQVSPSSRSSRVIHTGCLGSIPHVLPGPLGSIAAAGGRCLVHNEDEALTADAEARLKEMGRIDPELLIEWRSREAELVAVASTAAIVLGTGAVATFAHVSNPAVLDVIDAFRQLGGDIAAEACPQYFAIDENEVAKAGALRKFTPPARIRDEGDRSAMWDAVRLGRFSHFSTDHAPSTLHQKPRPTSGTHRSVFPGSIRRCPFSSTPPSPAT